MNHKVEIACDEVNLEEAKFYSESYKGLMTFLIANAEARKKKVNKYSKSLSAFMHGYEYPLTAWPIILSEERIIELNEFTSQISKIYSKALLSFFSDESDKFAAYFGLPAMYWDLVLQTGIDYKNLFVRHDFFFCDGKVKVLESNVGSNLGGWQHDWMTPAFDEIMNQFPETASLNLSRRSVIEKLLELSMNLAVKIKPRKQNLNVAIPLPNTQKFDQKAIADALKEVCIKVKPYSIKDVNVILFSDFEVLSFETDCRVTYQNNEIDVILLSMIGQVYFPQPVASRLFSSFCAKQIVFYDGLLPYVLGNKLLAALLHEPEMKKHLSLKELDFVKVHIPWSCKLNQREIVWKNSVTDLKELLINNREQFVLKKGWSMQGKDVVIGKGLSQEDWLIQVEQQFKHDDWIAQEYCQVDKMVGCGIDGKIDNFDYVWGLFDIGNQYQGAVVRGVESKKAGAVINAAIGAVVLIVYEESQYKKRMNDGLSKTRSSPEPSEINKFTQESFYSSSYKELVKYLSLHPEIKSRKLNKGSENVATFMRGFEDPISTWPIIISREIAENFSKVVSCIPRLYHKALIHYFANNSEAFPNYFGLPEVCLDLYLQMDFEPKQFVIRHDMVFSNKQIRVLESNVATNIGGWEHDWLQAEFDKNIKDFLRFSGLNITREEIVKNLFNFFALTAKKLKPNRKELNIAIFLSTNNSAVKTEIVGAITKICENLKNLSKVNPILVNTTEGLEFKSDKSVYFQKKELDAVIYMGSLGITFPDHIAAGFYTSAIHKKLLFLDGMNAVLMRNKALNALLYEPALESIFSKQELSVIKKHFPWCARLISQNVVWQKENLSLRELLLKEKDKFVLKKSLSYQGKDVFIGKLINKEEWSALIDSYMDTNEWVIQEYHKPDKVLACDVDGELKDFDLVWGVFDIGGEYRGVFVRGAPTEDCPGAINSATGAIDFFVYEESERRNKLSI